MTKYNSKKNKQDFLNYDKIKSKIAKSLLKDLEDENTKLTNKLKINKDLHEIWYIKPIDLTPKIYTHNKPTNHKQDIKLKNNNSVITKTVLPKLPFVTSKQKTEEEDVFTRKFRIMTANTARRKALKDQYFAKGPFVNKKNPKYDDIHRQLQNMKDIDQEEFITTFPKDPSNILFKNEMLSKTLPDLSSSRDSMLTKRNESNNTFSLPKIRYTSSEKMLYHPKEKYMNGRNPKDVFFSKVNETLDWVKRSEKLTLSRPDIYDNKTIDWLEITDVNNKHKCLTLKT